MAKKGNIVNYFSHDSNARNSDKLIRLRMKHKAAGYGIYFMILERLREEKDYTSVRDYNMIAYDLREDASLIKSVIEDFGLFIFTDDGKYFYSEGFKKRMILKDEQSRLRSEAGKKGMAHRWSHTISKDMEFDNNVITEQSQCDNNVITKVEKIITRKGKESKKENTPKGVSKKEKEIAAIAATQTRKEEFYNSLVPYTSKYPKEMIRSFFNYWSETNKSGSKMKFEMQQTWELQLRLNTWANREKFNKPNSSYDVGIKLSDNSTEKYDNDGTWKTH